VDSNLWPSESSNTELPRLPLRQGPAGQCHSTESHSVRHCTMIWRMGKSYFLACSVIGIKSISFEANLEIRLMVTCCCLASLRSSSIWDLFGNSLSLSLSRQHSHTHTLSLSLSLSDTHRHIYYPTDRHKHTLLEITHTHTHTHTHPHALSPTLSLTRTQKYYL
jgi:hypothetical protein